ncbi:hypothetical protein COS81_02760 [candidate division WWE3 bacterium CG06_land_8_20_14_3_00_42_16]|uniref:histidine kinase n=2 Tax=Katanobacteria TaxID=422282 RepID=A0A2M7AMZ6_UNCKA|nr:MAG: hypothetical protein COS81_02760 [candidate division WWE3 bacterium CG06_land_8_20_14_3_00_42_16]PJC68491.1 MAG: hypothetical protein CO015_03830 [candidate division WWE3 bacterium CG_4_8_14_3_um_filter_42_11]
MFHSARIKLTAWYLAIIMTISLSFSMIVYTRVTSDVQGRLVVIENRLRSGELGFRPPSRPGPFFIEEIEDTRRRVLWMLILTNGLILIFSGVAGYFLAGKTLEPIEVALQEQQQFITDASHELRTPLTALKTSMEVALRGQKMSLSEAHEVIASNLEDVNSLQSLSDRLLSLAHYQTNGSSLIFKPLPVTETLEEAVRKVKFLAKAKEIEVNLKSADLTLDADQESFIELLVIFLDNAVKYTLAKGSINVSAEADKKHLYLAIADSGIGIKSEDLPHIFDRFFRADTSRSKAETKGFGLGLSLAKKIIESYHGDLDMVSKVGSGTTFTLKFPLKHA